VVGSGLVFDSAVELFFGDWRRCRGYVSCGVNGVWSISGVILFAVDGGRAVRANSACDGGGWGVTGLGGVSEKWTSISYPTSRAALTRAGGVGAGFVVRQLCAAIAPQRSLVCSVL